MIGSGPDNPRREIFNALAEEWDSMCALKEGQARTLRESLSRMEIPRDGAVLDVGCGTGVLVPYLLPLLGEEGRYVGLDVADAMIRVARSKFADRRVKFVNEDIYNYDCRGGPYDFTIVFSAFPHLHDKKSALATLARATRPGGRLCIMHVESSSAINAYHRERVTNEVLRNDRLPPIEELLAIVDGREWKSIRAEDREGLYLLLLERNDGLVL